MQVPFAQLNSVPSASESEAPPWVMTITVSETGPAAIRRWRCPGKRAGAIEVDAPGSHTDVGRAAHDGQIAQDDIAVAGDREHVPGSIAAVDGDERLGRGGVATVHREAVRKLITGDAVGLALHCQKFTVAGDRQMLRGVGVCSRVTRTVAGQV